MGQIFNKGLQEDQRQKGLLKRLKNIEDKADNQLRAIEGKKDEGMKSIGLDRGNLSPDGIRIFNQIVQKDKQINYAHYYVKPSARYEFNFMQFENLKSFFKDIYYGRKSIDAFKRDQDIFKTLLDRDKGLVFENMNNLYEGRELIIYGFENRLFPLASGNYYDQYADSENESSTSSEGPNEVDGQELSGGQGLSGNNGRPPSSSEDSSRNDDD